jgi:hypothetical protein
MLNPIPLLLLLLLPLDAAEHSNPENIHEYFTTIEIY